LKKYPAPPAPARKTLVFGFSDLVGEEVVDPVPAEFKSDNDKAEFARNQIIKLIHQFNSNPSRQSSRLPELKQVIVDLSTKGSTYLMLVQVNLFFIKNVFSALE
jgi:hypothetical protein